MTDKPFTSRYSRHFQEQLLALTDSVYELVGRSIDLLEAMPGIGHAYEPSYESDLPPVPCQCKFVTNTTKCLYYVVDDEAGVIRFFHLGDTRQDPRTLFESVHSGK